MTLNSPSQSAKSQMRSLALNWFVMFVCSSHATEEWKKGNIEVLLCLIPAAAGAGAPPPASPTSNLLGWAVRHTQGVELPFRGATNTATGTADPWIIPGIIPGLSLELLPRSSSCIPSRNPNEGKPTAGWERGGGRGLRMGLG